MIAQIDPTLVPPVYHDFLLDFKTRYWILYGGRGSAKTKTAVIKHVLRAYKNEYFKCVYVRKAQAHLRDSLYAALKTAISDLGLSWFFRCYDSDYRIIGANGNSFIPKGVDDPELTKGVEEVSHLLIEEISELDFEDLLTLDKLLRTPKTNVQLTAMFNPIMDTHWLRKHFFSPDDRHKPNETFGDNLKILRTTFRDNNFIDRESYHQTLLLGAAGNRNRISVDIDGDWGIPENNAPWLYSFSEEKHIEETLPFLPAFPVYLSFDFNREPVTCLAVQQSPHKGASDSFVHFINEFAIDAQLKELCARIKTTYPNSILFVTGDAAGNHGDIGFEDRNDTYYQMIRSYLGISPRQMQLNSKNMTHNDSRLLCNTLLYGYEGIKISRKHCPLLINDCIIATVDDKSATPSKIKKDRDTYKMDLFDAFRYFWQTHFKEYSERVMLRKVA